MNKNHLKKISPLFVVAAVLMVIVSSVPLSPRQAHSASPIFRIVYGHVDGVGNITDGSGDFTATFLGNNPPGYAIYPNNDAEYQINFNAAAGFTSPPSVVATIATPGWRNGTAIVETPTASGVKIRIGRVGEQLGQNNGFAFIAIGQSSAPTDVNVVFGSINGGRGGVGTPGAADDPGSGGWSSYWSGNGTYNVNFASGLFSETPTVIATPSISSPVDCLSVESPSAGGVLIRNYTNYCLSPDYAWTDINFLAVGKGGRRPANLAVAEGSWTRGGVSLATPTLTAGSTGIASVSNGAGWPGTPSGYTVNFNSRLFAQKPITFTNASTQNYPPMFCSSGGSPDSSSAWISFTGGSEDQGGGANADTCTYGDDRNGYYAHTTLGATMIAVGFSPIDPLLASCSVVNGSIPYGTSAQFSASVSGGAAGTYSYLWNYPAGLASCGDAASCSTNRLNSSLAPGAFNVTVTDSAGSQSNIAECPGVNIIQPSVVAASFSGTASQLTFSATTPVNVTTSAKIYVRNIGPASSTMDWFCGLDPSYVPPPGLTVDTSQCSGFGLRGGAPPF